MYIIASLFLVRIMIFFSSTYIKQNFDTFIIENLAFYRSSDFLYSGSQDFKKENLFLEHNFLK